MQQMDYTACYADFRWDGFCDELFDWNWKEMFNIAYAAVDRNARDRESTAIYHVRRDLGVDRLTFAELKTLTNQFAHVLAELGLAKGDRVARLMPRVPEAYIGFLGTWKAGMVDVPLYTAFGRDAVAYRIKDCGAKALITDNAGFEKIKPVLSSLPDLSIIITDSSETALSENMCFDYRLLMAEADGSDPEITTTLNDPALLVYTSGTTGPPKGTTILHKGVISVLPYARYCLDVHKDEMYWGFADPGWTYGLLSAGSAVMALGRGLVVFEPRFEAESWYKTVINLGITNFTAAPTAFRAIMAADQDLLSKYKPVFRYLSSAGEPLNPEVIHWFEANFGVPIRDMYGITEVSMVIGNNPTFKIKPGSCGKPIPGFNVKLKDENSGTPAEYQVGSICVEQNDHFISSCYWGQEEKYRNNFVDEKWFDTGDLAYRDEEGYYFFVGRKDDVISSSGYRIGPFEVENCIIEHPAVAECAVIGKPDALRGEIVKAFVVLKNGVAANNELKEEIKELSRTKLSKHNYPREIDFIDELPKTSSGKIQRRILRGIA